MNKLALSLMVCLFLTGCMTAQQREQLYQSVWDREYVSRPAPRKFDTIAVVEVESAPVKGTRYWDSIGRLTSDSVKAEVGEMFSTALPYRNGSESVIIRISNLKWSETSTFEIAPSLAIIDPRTGGEVFRASHRARRTPQGLAFSGLAETLSQIKADIARVLSLPEYARLASPPGGSQPSPVPARFPQAEARTPPKPTPAFAAQPVLNRFPRGPERSDDIAVIIGNADYARLGRDIPDVRPAHADAEGARLYATQALGVRDGNVIFLKDATSAQMTRVFGSKDNHQGQLFDWVKPGKSRVYVYYSGHGAPGSQGGSPYLVPTDADSARIELNGYSLKQLYDNLGKLPAESVTLVLEACFSGVSPAGSVLGKASPVFFEVKAPAVPASLTVISAGAANQMASWETDESAGLFTKYYLKAMAGEADADKDGRVSLDELDRYLKDTMTYYARRHYGRDQNAQIVVGGRP